MACGSNDSVLPVSAAAGPRDHVITADDRDEPECSALCTTDVPAAPAAAEDNLATVDRWRFSSAMKGGGSCGRGSLMWAAVGCTAISLLSAASSMRSGDRVGRVPCRRTGRGEPKTAGTSPSNPPTPRLSLVALTAGDGANAGGSPPWPSAAASPPAPRSDGVLDAALGHAWASRLARSETSRQPVCAAAATLAILAEEGCHSRASACRWGRRGARLASQRGDDRVDQPAQESAPIAFLALSLGIGRDRPPPETDPLWRFDRGRAPGASLAGGSGRQGPVALGDQPVCAPAARLTRGSARRARPQGLAPFCTRRYE
eukprot:scaffold30238_cov129-Isochrysis_galbana.AAC.3